ncbi:hypothetical protein BDV11DRAFT_177223 [Aspergillus similis]
MNCSLLTIFNIPLLSISSISYNAWFQFLSSSRDCLALFPLLCMLCPVTAMPVTSVLVS